MMHRLHKRQRIVLPKELLTSSEDDEEHAQEVEQEEQEELSQEEQEFENTKAALELNVFSKLRKDKLLKELEHVAAKSPVSACHMSMDMDACACILT
jgi:hypothetical protein